MIGGIVVRLLALLPLIAVAVPAAAQDRPEPEAATQVTTQATAQATAQAATPGLAVAAHHMAVAANPLAAEAGRDVLRDGGSAVDAAVAMSLVLGLVEPQSSGLGGGGYMLVWDVPRHEMFAYDGRETAPAAATPDRFLDASGKPMKFAQARLGGRATGVPGLIALLRIAHNRHGRLPWDRLVAPAIRLAEEGFRVSPRMHASIAATPALARFPAARAYFYGADGEPLPAGTLLRNPAYAATLKRIAVDGATAFYEGETARAVIDAVDGDTVAPAHMTSADLTDYQVRIWPPVCGRYRSLRVCGPPPSTSGPVAVIQMLGLLGRFQAAKETQWTPAAAHLFAEAAKLALADRARYMGDPNFTPVPTEPLVAPAYVAARARLIDPARSMGHAPAGDPTADGAPVPAPRTPDRQGGTTHMIAVDDEGDVVSFTASIESAFGSHLMAGGFVLNNELTDFDFEPERDGRPAPNRVEGGKRPRSAMSPMIVLDRVDRPVMAVGAAGGARIIPYVAKTIMAVVDWGLDPAAAVALPNVAGRNAGEDGERVEVEAGTAAEALAPALEALGHRVRPAPLASGLTAVTIARGRIEGAADPRREGVALGD